MASADKEEGEDAMRPFEAEEYAEGWRIRIVGGLRTDNPYKRPFNGAWDRYRRDAWDKGWRDCDCGAVWVDPRKRRSRV